MIFHTNGIDFISGRSTNYNDIYNYGQIYQNLREDINAMMAKETNNELDSILMAELSESVAEGLEVGVF